MGVNKMVGNILTLENATRSRYGKNLWGFPDVINHPLRWEEVHLTLTDSSLNIPEELKQKIDENWRKEKEKKPNAFDAPKLRFEGIEWNNVVLMVYLSTGITYFQHNVLRNESLPLTHYPTPMTINDLQETLDGYLLFGARNPKISDQSGGAVIGAGFHDPIKGKKGLEFPGGIFETTLKEAFEETEYMNGDKPIIHPIRHELMRVITLVRGSNTDITMGFYVPLNASSNQVALNRGNREYDEIFKIRNSTSNLERLLSSGNLEGMETNGGFVGYSVPLADHPIGVVEAFLRLKEKLPRVGYLQH